MSEPLSMRPHQHESMALNLLHEAARSTGSPAVVYASQAQTHALLAIAGYLRIIASKP